MNDMFAPQIGFGGHMNNSGVNGGFTSLSTFNSFNDAGGMYNGGGAMKRTSTSTTFVNGKKVMTKK